MTKHRTFPFCLALCAMACGSLGAGVARAQAGTTAVPQFEVVSVKEVKPSDAESGGSTINSRLPDRFVATHITLFFLVLEAYELKGHQLVGAPDWTWDKAYNVIGTYPDGKRPPAHVIHLMLQQLLAERFGLKVHREQRELPAYDLVVARKDGRLGPQIHESGMDCKAWVAAGRPKTASDRPNPVAPGEERPVCTMFTTRTWMSGGARAMTDLAGRLEALVDRPVADKTGLTGAYDIDLQWDPADLHIAQPGAGTSEAPSLFTALEEQLGLKLVAHREMTDVVVIDGIKPAGPN